MDELLPDILNRCLERLEDGATVDECLVAYPPQQAELELPLRMAAQLRELPRPPMPATTRTRLETQMLELAARRAASSSIPAPTAPPAWRSLSPNAILSGILRTFGYGGSLGKPWLRLATAAAAIVLALVLGTGALAAARAIVDAIRPQPTAMPTATPLPTPSPLAVLTLDAQIEQIAQERWVVGGTTVVLSSTTTISGTPILGAIAHIQGNLLTDGAILAHSITVETLPPTPTSTPAPTQRISPTEAAPAAATSAPVAPPPQADRSTTTPIPAAPATAPPQPSQGTGGEHDDQKHSCNGQQRGRDEKKCDPKPHEDKKPGKPRKK